MSGRSRPATTPPAHPTSNTRSSCWWRPDDPSEEAPDGAHQVLDRAAPQGPARPAGGAEPPAAVEVLYERRVEHRGEIGVEGDHVDLLVEEAGAPVEVGRPDVGHGAV